MAAVVLSGWSYQQGKISVGFLASSMITKWEKQKSFGIFFACFSTQENLNRERLDLTEFFTDWSAMLLKCHGATALQKRVWKMGPIYALNFGAQKSFGFYYLSDQNA